MTINLYHKLENKKIRSQNERRAAVDRPTNFWIFIKKTIFTSISEETN